MSSTYCFRAHFRTVQTKFQRLAKALKNFPGRSNKKEFVALRNQVQVLSRRNIHAIEKSIDALFARITRRR